MIRPGDVVRYDHPDWGPCRGRVLLGQRGVDPTRDEDAVPSHLRESVLVQDLSPNGAREWWPVADVVAE